jgi:hypothetical protein
MRPLEHFLSLLDKMERGSPRDRADETVARGFTDLTAAVIGREEAQDLCGALLELSREKPGSEERLSYLHVGYAAAFLLGEFDDSMELDAGEWEEVRGALEDAAGEMNINTLGALMGELLERGKL